MSINSNLFSQNVEYYTVELGVSYDPEFLEKFTSEQLARDAIRSMVDNVNEIYGHLFNLNNDEIQILFEVRQIRVISDLPFHAGGNYVRAIAGNWNFSRDGIDLCFTPDMVHHVTGRTADLVTLGHTLTGGPCYFYQGGDAEGASYSRYDNSLQYASYAMAHELLHQFGIGHESVPCYQPFGTIPFFCEAETFFNQSFSALTVSSTIRDRFTEELQFSKYNCCKDDNYQDIIELPENCQTCVDRVRFSTPLNNVNEYLYDDDDCGVDFSRFVTLETIFQNSCTMRNLQVELLFNHNHITSLDLPPGYSEPDIYNPGGPYTTRRVSPNFEIGQGGDHSTVYGITFNGSAIYDIVFARYYTPMRVWYQTQAGQGSTHGIYYFHLPYVIDKRGQAIVYDSELTTPIQDQQYNFCSGIRHHIYIGDNAELIINQPRNFCNTHFIMGENSKITISSLVKFDNCTFKTCAENIKWDGINVLNNATLFVLGNSKFYYARTGIKSHINATITVAGINKTDKSVEFNNCSYGIDIKESGTLSVTNAIFDKVSIGIDISKVNAIIDNCTFHATSGGQGVRAFGESGTTISISNSTFNKHLWAISIRRAYLFVENVTCRDVYTGIFINDAPNIYHNIENYLSYDAKWNGISCSNSFSVTIPSLLNSGGIYNSGQIGMRLSNTGSPDKESWIITSLFQNNKTALRILNSDNNEVKQSSFSYTLNSGRDASDMKFIHMSSSNNNKIAPSGESNSYIIGSFVNIQPSDLYRHIFLDNAGMGNEIRCNIMERGNRGINVWGPSISNIVANEFYLIDRGLYYGLHAEDLVTTSGPQYFKANAWTDPDPSVIIGATHLGANDDIVNESQYLMHSSSSTYKPAFEAISEDWFDYEFNNNPSNCASGLVGGDNGGGNQLFQMMASGTGFQGFSFSSGMQTMAEDYLYDAIQNGETFGSSAQSVLDYAALLNTNPDLTKVHQAESLMYAPASNQQSMDQAYLVLQDSLQKYADTTLNLSNEHRESLLHNIQSLAQIAQAQYGVYNIELFNRLDTAESLLSSVSNAQVYWYNKSKALLILLRKWKGIDPSISELSEMEGIATQCPFTGGEGVYIARGILEEYQTEPIYYDDVDLCEKALPRILEKYPDQVHIYPNPTQEICYFESQTKITSIEIVDITGRVMGEWKPAQTRFEISLAGWNSGLYHARIKLESGKTVEYKKIILIP